MDNSELQDIIKKIKETFFKYRTSVIGPNYQDMNKRVAELYFIINDEPKGIYHLSEAHAATLRQQAMIRYDVKEDQIRKPHKHQNVNYTVKHGIQKKYIEFGNNTSYNEEEGLLMRLREMPSEWTVVQLTRQFDPLTSRSLCPRKTLKPTGIHITRLPCGSSLDEMGPVSVLVGPPESSEGMPTLFDLMKEAKLLLRSKKIKASEIIKDRETASSNIKAVVSELSERVLREWKVLLLGSLCSSNYTEQVRDCVNHVVDSDKHKDYQIEQRDRELLWLVASGAPHLNQAQVESAVCCLVDSEALASDLIAAISALGDSLGVLMAARRHPVLLILDDDLDPCPWEMIPVLKRHPVSRVPSIHFLHAIFQEHKENIQDGCRLVTGLDLGFYIINPGSDLKRMEDRLMTFLKSRTPEWKGVNGIVPSQQEFCNALSESNIFLYCGHFNGSQHLRPEDLSMLRVVALPMLFGCASVAQQELGGRSQPSGIADKYFMAGCACLLGMLWTVTSDETDCMTATMLNSWLPGEPLDLKSFDWPGDLLNTPREPELLRIMRHARESANLFSNASAFVARGIPVKMIENSSENTHQALDLTERLRGLKVGNG